MSVATCLPTKGSFEVSEMDAQFHERLGRYSAFFESAFRRRDQAKWLPIYLRGLLKPEGEKKTIEAIARSLQGDDLGVTDLAQALQNFINQSPWDEKVLW